MARVLNKTGIEWSRHPEAFEARIARSEEEDPANPGNLIIVWRLTTGYEVLTQQGERIRQDDVWAEPPPPEVAMFENVRNAVLRREKGRNSIP